MMIKLDKNTYGDTKAAIILVDILEQFDNPRYVKRVSRCFHDFTRGFWELMGIKDIGCRLAVMDLWIHSSVERVEQTDLPDKIKSYLINIEKAQNARVANALRVQRSHDIQIDKESSRKKNAIDQKLDHNWEERFGK